MCPLHQILPAAKDVVPEDLAELAIRTIAEPLGVGAAEAVAYCNELSALLTNDPRTRSYPALQALGFWLHPGAVVDIVQSYLSAPETALRAPRGIVFQIPPENVDVYFGYTSALSLLAGNVTLVRLPHSTSPDQELLLALIREVLAKSPDSVRNRLLFLRYGEDDTVTSALSALCDARVVWGDDETIRHIRSIPLPVLAQEVCYALRFSAAAFNAQLYMDLSQPERQKLVRAFFNDVYLFDQMTSASPRLLIWVGNKEQSDLAVADFYPRLADYADANYGAPGAGENLSKLNAQFLALHDLKLESSTTYNASLTLLTLASWQGLSAYRDLRFGHGLLLAARLEQLRDLAVYVEKRDQTLALWGFGPDETHAFISLCGGRGFDRIVPIGQALSIGPLWNGSNIFDVLTKMIQVTV